MPMKDEIEDEIRDAPDGVPEEKPSTLPTKKERTMGPPEVCLLPLSRVSGHGLSISTACMCLSCFLLSMVFNNTQ